MNDRQENWLSRAVTVDKTLDENAGVFAAVPLMVTGANNIKMKMAEVNGLARVQQTPITGTTKDKARLKGLAITAVMELVGPMKSYAESIKDYVFFEEVNFTRKKLRVQRDTLVGNTMVMLNGKANDHLGVLGAAGVTAPLIAASVAATTTYVTHLAVPRTALGVRKDATAQLKTELGVLNGYIKGMRMHIELYKNSNETFYNVMLSAINIVDTGSRKKGIMNDE